MNAVQSCQAPKAFVDSVFEKNWENMTMEQLQIGHNHVAKKTTANINLAIVIVEVSRGIVGFNYSCH